MTAITASISTKKEKRKKKAREYLQCTFIWRTKRIVSYQDFIVPVIKINE